MRALVDLQPTSALVERRVRAYLHSSELDDFSYPWPDTQSGCQSVRVCKALRGGVRTSASTSRIGGAPLPAVPALRGTPYALVVQSDYEALLVLKKVSGARLFVGRRVGLRAWFSGFVVSWVAVSSAYRLFVPTLNCETGLQSIAFLLRAHQLRVSSRAGLGYPSVGRSSAGHGGPEM